MQDVLPEGGVIRKLWIGETAKYRDHCFGSTRQAAAAASAAACRMISFAATSICRCRWTPSCMVFSSAA